MSDLIQISVSLIILSIIITLMIKKRRKYSFGKKYKNQVDLLTGQQFEYFLSALFYKMGYKNKVTKGSYDFGADLIVSDGKTKIVIQAKRYQAKVGIKAVQEVFSAMHYYDADKAYVFTNNYFTKSASILAHKLNIQLYDREQMERLKNKYF